MLEGLAIAFGLKELLIALDEFAIIQMFGFFVDKSFQVQSTSKLYGLEI